MKGVLKNKFLASMDLIRITKQYGTLLLLIPALWSLTVAAQGSPTLGLLSIFFMGAFLMRSAGCAINDIADRNFDGHVERTRNRPLPSGRLSVVEAGTVSALLLGASLFLVLQLNPLTQILSLGGLLLAVVYPFSKRITSMPQLVLGAAFGWGAILAWAAVRNTIEVPVIMIFLANLCWATAYDTIYALMDREDDLKIGVRSTALLFGRNSWIAVGVLFGLTTLFLLLLGQTASLGSVYYGSVAAASVWFVYEVWIIRRPRSAATFFFLFKSNVGAGFLILLGLVLDYQL